MEIEVSHKSARVPVTIFSIRGDMGAESSDLLRHKARSSYEAGTRHLLLDLSEVGFVSSAGLGAIHHTFLLLRSDSPAERDEVVRKGIMSGTYSSPHLKLLKPNRHVKKALGLAGFDMFLEIFTDIEKAVDSF